MTKTYISGPMTGIPEFNFPAFFEAEGRLAALGWDPVNPAQKDRENGLDARGLTGTESPDSLGFDLRAALLWDLEQVSESAVVAVLPGWHRSKGAQSEVALAIALGIPVARLEGFGPVGNIDIESVIYAPEVRRDLPPLVGFGGLLRSGKDTAADYLVREHGYVKVFMSDPLNEAMLALDPILGDDRNGHEVRYSDEVRRAGYTAAKKHPEVRRLLQKLGTEVGRQIIDEDVWVKIAGARIDALRAAGTPVVITGIRFENELRMIQERGGVNVWVERGATLAEGAHASEATLNQQHFDVVLHNTGSLDDLYELTEEVAA